jgi:dTDP-4-dehydrorhamnose 3,5-epimerase-like enzyme
MRIPPGVAHGYKVIGDRPAVLFEVAMDGAGMGDVGQIAYDDISIAYEWEGLVNTRDSRY